MRVVGYFPIYTVIKKLLKNNTFQSKQSKINHFPQLKVKKLTTAKLYKNRCTSFSNEKFCHEGKIH